MSCEIAETCGDLKMVAGDTDGPIIDVVDGACAPIDISAVAQIAFTILVSATVSIVKTLSPAAGIVILDGTPKSSFQVTLQHSDTVGLSGWYSYSAVITDGVGNVSTVRRGYVEIQP